MSVGRPVLRGNERKERDGVVALLAWTASTKRASAPPGHAYWCAWVSDDIDIRAASRVIGAGEPARLRGIAEATRYILFV
jgi:hypothetical protein